MLTDGVMYSSWRDVREWRWPNFTPRELACPSSGNFYYHPESFDKLQEARKISGRPFIINSAHRSWWHNIKVHGAPRSAHRFVAFDISTRGHNLVDLYRALQRSGFTTFGFYQSFIHVDVRPGRRWFGSQEAKMMWMPLL